MLSFRDRAQCEQKDQAVRAIRKQKAITTCELHNYCAQNGLIAPTRSVSPAHQHLRRDRVIDFEIVCAVGLIISLKCRWHKPEVIKYNGFVGRMCMRLISAFLVKAEKVKWIMKPTQCKHFGLVKIFKSVRIINT